MKALNALVAQAARALDEPPGVAAPPEAEVQRLMQICNACRYCEGFCAVFPAMARRLAFPPADVHYLANLCHQCGACLHACQYASPHEFAVNVPRSMAQVRATTYQRHAWPQAWGQRYERQGLVGVGVLTAALALFLVAAAVLQGSWWAPPAANSFYSVFPHGVLVGLFAPAFLFACLALGLGLRNFWRSITPGQGDGLAMAAGAETTKNVLQLTHLGGGHGEGCNNEDDAFTLWRRRCHHATFYGFMLCFASTCVATLYHYVMGWHAPYAVGSLPVVLGVVGGAGLVLGPAGLLGLSLKRDSRLMDAKQTPVDRAFTVQLFSLGVTGLGLLVWRDTSAMTLWLCVHLACVLAFFLTMPYGKFAHGLFRAAALLKWNIEKRQASKLRLGSE